MSLNNPHFKQRLRPAYELSHLLRTLPAGLNLTTDADAADTRLRLEAAERHADNYLETLLSGIESLGRVMFSAAENEDWPVEQRDVARIGCLISDLAVQIQFLGEFRGSVADLIAEGDKKGSRK